MPLRLLLARNLTCSITHSPPPLPNPSFSFKIFSPFSSNTQTPNTVISDFLLNECRFSHSELAQVFRRQKSLSRTRSAQTAQEAVQLLRGYGFTENQVKKTIVGWPCILQNKQMKPKIELLKTLGFTDQELPTFLSLRPRLLAASLEKTLISNITYLESLFGSRPNLFKALKRTPQLLDVNIEKQLKPRLDLLKHSGVQGELLSLLISQKPSILFRNRLESLKLDIEYAKNMGILEGSKTFIYALHVLSSYSTSSLENKMKLLTSLGFLQEELHELLMRDPGVLQLSINKMQENANFLIQTAGLLPKIIVTYNRLLHYSLEKRLKPRYAVFRVLTSMQHSNPLPSLTKMFGVGEQTFIEKFINCSPQPAILYEVYQGKSATDCKI